MSLHRSKGTHNITHFSFSLSLSLTIGFLLGFRSVKPSWIDTEENVTTTTMIFTTTIITIVTPTGGATTLTRASLILPWATTTRARAPGDSAPALLRTTAPSIVPRIALPAGAEDSGRWAPRVPRNSDSTATRRHRRSLARNEGFLSPDAVVVRPVSFIHFFSFSLVWFAVLLLLKIESWIESFSFSTNFNCCGCCVVVIIATSLSCYCFYGRLNMGHVERVAFCFSFGYCSGYMFCLDKHFQQLIFFIGEVQFNLWWGKLILNYGRIFYFVLTLQFIRGKRWQLIRSSTERYK